MTLSSLLETARAADDRLRNATDSQWNEANEACIEADRAVREHLKGLGLTAEHLAYLAEIV